MIVSNGGSIRPIQIRRGKPMLLEYNDKKLNEALDDFYNVTGVGISILREDYSPLGSRKANNTYCRLMQSSKRGLIKCLESSRHLLEACKETKSPMMSICYAGLVEIAVPIIYNENVIGYAMLGHVKQLGTEVDFSAALAEFPVDARLAEEIFEALPAYEAHKIKSIMNMAQMLGKFIILENFVRPKENQTVEQIRRFVYEHIDKKLTAQVICRGAHVSRSTLYSTLSTHLGCTVSEFIGNVKIERAKELLQKTDMTIEDISDGLGFSSPAYFGKVFKRLVGMSPLKYRKMSLSGL